MYIHLNYNNCIVLCRISLLYTVEVTLQMCLIAYEHYKFSSIVEDGIGKNLWRLNQFQSPTHFEKHLLIIFNMVSTPFWRKWIGLPLWRKRHQSLLYSYVFYERNIWNRNNKWEREQKMREIETETQCLSVLMLVVRIPFGKILAIGIGRSQLTLILSHKYSSRTVIV